MSDLLDRLELEDDVHYYKNKLEELVKELKGRLYLECVGCEEGREHILNEEQGVYYYKSAHGGMKECGMSWVKDLVDRYR
jgi:hypothetical protein